MDNDQPNFYLLAEKQGWDAAFQVEMLLAYIQEETPADKFAGWCKWLGEVTAEPEVKEAEMPVEHTSDLDAFFDRDLVMACVDNLTLLDPDGHSEGCEYDGNTFWPDGEYFNLLEDVLRDGVCVEDEDHSSILGGYYVEFPEDDGIATALIMVVNGDVTGSPFVDAVLALPTNSKYRDVPNVSLPPRNQLSGVYIFDYPDGTTRTVRLAVNT